MNVRDKEHWRRGFLELIGGSVKRRPIGQTDAASGRLLVHSKKRKTSNIRITNRRNAFGF